MKVAVFAFDPNEEKAPETLVLFCPGARGLPVDDLVTLSLLPIHDWNSDLLRGARDLKAAGAVSPCACVLAIDPFRRMRDVLLELRQSGFGRVCNFPSPSAIEGEMRSTLDELGFGMDRELQFVREAVALGLEVIAFATDRQHAENLLQAGAIALVTTSGSWPAFEELSLEVPVHVIR